MSGGFNLDDYVPVSERIEKFYELHPDGRIVPDPPVVISVDGQTFVGCTARVYRLVTASNDRPDAVGSAWEPFPGKTPFTRDSEAQNAETSAVGRALANAGIEVRRGVSSREDVQNRQQSDASAERVCGSCGEPIRAGEALTKADGRYVHKDCVG